MKKTYYIDRKVTLWVRDTYQLEWTDSENLKELNNIIKWKGKTEWIDTNVMYETASPATWDIIVQVFNNNEEILIEA